MHSRGLYTKIMLTIIAVTLALNFVAQIDRSIAYAQATTPQYSVELLSATGKSPTASLAKAINDAAKGRELVSLMPFEQPGGFLAVYKVPAR